MAKIRIEPSGCWTWTAFIHPKGYGVFSVKAKSVSAHRWAYEHFIGPIPPGMTIDHTCHRKGECRLASGCPHRRCVNPDHLEAVTNAENVRRGNAGRQPGTYNPWFCKRGHPLFGENLYVHPTGRKRCRKCRQIHYQKYIQTEKGRDTARRAVSAYRARKSA